MTGLWKHADFRRLWAGETVSQFGSAVTRVALPLVAITLLAATPFASCCTTPCCARSPCAPARPTSSTGWRMRDLPTAAPI